VILALILVCAMAPPPPVVPPLIEARLYAAIEIGWHQYRCLDRLVQRESRWRVTARNRSSGAAGLFQALPPEKMARYGADYLTNAMVQMRFGIAYIAARYRTACRALQHSYDRGWY
jgi:hypothetical protein